MRRRQQVSTKEAGIGRRSSSSIGVLRRMLTRTRHLLRCHSGVLEEERKLKEDEVAGAKEAGSPGAGWNVTVTVGTRMGGYRGSTGVEQEERRRVPEGMSQFVQQ